MRPAPLAPEALLDIWERGSARHLFDQALLILQRACPAETHESLSGLTIGQRDALLLLVRAQTFGDRMESYVECPSCMERLEFTLSCETLLADAAYSGPRQKKFACAGVEWELRAPTSRDLAVVALASESEAVDALLTCCVTPASASTDLLVQWTDSLRATLAAELASLDPQAEIRIELTCPACKHIWHSVFDITAFLSKEIPAHSRRLLQEVDVLARRYGWAESDVLRMSGTRRRFYVQMALS